MSLSGTATFSSAHATTRNGRAGTVTSPWWGTTSITLRPHASRFFAGTAGGSGSEAAPSELSADGSAFSVVYQGSSSSGGQAGPPGPVFSGRQHLVHLSR